MTVLNIFSCMTVLQLFFFVLMSGAPLGFIPFLLRLDLFSLQDSCLEQDVILHFITTGFELFLLPFVTLIFVTCFRCTRMQIVIFKKMNKSVLVKCILWWRTVCAKVSFKLQRQPKVTLYLRDCTAWGNPTSWELDHSESKSWQGKMKCFWRALRHTDILSLLIGRKWCLVHSQSHTSSHQYPQITPTVQVEKFTGLFICQVNVWDGKEWS